MTPQHDYDGLQVVPNSNPHDAPEVHEPPSYPIPSDRKVDAFDAHHGGGEKMVVAGEERRRATICGVRRRTFWIIAAIAVIIVVAAVVGGAVGATRRSSDSTSSAQSSTSTLVPSVPQSTSPPTSTSTSTSATASVTATAGLARNCTLSTNGTLYSSYFNNGLNGEPSSAAGLVFQELCNFVTDGGNNLAEVPVPTFEQCIELCASWNFWASSTECQGVDYRNQDGVCWLITGTAAVKADSNSVDAAIFNKVAVPAQVTIGDPNGISSPVTNCVDESNYTSRFVDGADGTPPSGAGLKFQKHCNQDTSGQQNIAQVYLPSFNACIELCASINFWGNSRTCAAATYAHNQGYCWVKRIGDSPNYNSQADLALLI